MISIAVYVHVFALIICVWVYFTHLCSCMRLTTHQDNIFAIYSKGILI